MLPALAKKLPILTMTSEQHYKLVINKVAWYAVHIILEIDPRRASDSFTGDLYFIFTEQ